MRLLIPIAIVIAMVVLAVILLAKRPGPEPQVEPIDADHESPPPGPDETRRMVDPPPGSRGDRERHDMP